MMTKSMDSTPWPPPNGLTTVVVSRASTVLSMYGSARIAAPASLVFSIVRDISNYPTWNTFCPRATIHSQPPTISPDAQQILHEGTSFTFHVVMDASKPNSITDTRLRVTDVSTPQEQSGYVSGEILEDGIFTKDQGRVYRIAWTGEGKFVTRGLKSERWHEVIELGEEECEVRTWECQGGMLARAVKYYYKDVLQQKFEGWCLELKREAEKRVAESKT